MTFVFKGEVIGRLYFNENHLMKMTGGWKNRVYLPGKWYEETTEKIYVYVEGFEEGVLKNIKLFNVNM